jgi:hypothetical protein
MTCHSDKGPAAQNVDSYRSNYCVRQSLGDAGVNTRYGWPFLSRPFRQQPLDWSRDGRFLLFTQITKSSEIMVQTSDGGQPLSLLGPERAARGLRSSLRARQACLVRAMADFQRGRDHARWRGDGKEIFYLALDGQLMAVQVSGEGTSFQFSSPELLFNATPPVLRSPSFDYDVAADGQRFLMIEPAEKAEYLPLTLVSNWLTMEVARESHSPGCSILKSSKSSTGTTLIVEHPLGGKRLRSPRESANLSHSVNRRCCHTMTLTSLCDQGTM